MSGFPPASRQRLFTRWHKGRWGGHELRLTEEETERICVKDGEVKSRFWVYKCTPKKEVHEFLQRCLSRRNSSYDRITLYFCFEEDLIQFKLQFL